MVLGRLLGTAAKRVREGLSPGRSLLGRTVTGGLWVGLLNVLDRIVRLGTLVVLAGLLTPRAFGVIGLGTLTLTFLRRFSRLGLREALVQKEQADIDEYLATTWVLRTVRGTVLAAVAVLLAPTVASVVGVAALTPVIRALALLPLVAGLRNPGVVYFQKDLEFRQEFVYRFASTLAYATVALVTAVVFGNVWALVCGLLGGAIARTGLSYLLHPYRPAVQFDPAAARDLLDYGKWLFGSSIVVFLLNRADDALVGVVLGAPALGLYQMAFRFSNAPATEVTHVISRVTFPSFSKAQTDPETLREGFFGTVRFVAYVAFPMAAGIAAVTPLFVGTVLGPEWLAMATTMQLLAAWGALRALASVLGPLFQGIGHPEYSTALQFSRLVIVLALVYPLTLHWGTVGTAAALLTSGVIQIPVAFVVAVRSVDGQFRRLGRTLAFPAAGTVLMGGTVLLAKVTITSIPAVLKLVLLIALGIAVYAGILLAGDRLLNVGLRRDLTTLYSALQE